MAKTKDPDQLRDHYHIVAVDLRGHNLSFGPAAGYSWTDDMAEDIVQLLPQLTAEPTVLIGHSLGAMVAIPASIKAPNAVVAIVLEDPPITHTKSDHALRPVNDRTITEEYLWQMHHTEYL